jgi:DNA-directed RNA polymerase I, II, and III subunit RPABC5
MTFPIRCFTCGKVIGKYEVSYKKMIKTKTNKEALDKLKIKRNCCRRMFISHVDLIDYELLYERK